MRVAGAGELLHRCRGRGRSGTLDSAFGTAGRATAAFDLGGNLADDAEAVAVQSDGRIVLGGNTRSTVATDQWAFARLTPSGVLDVTFDGDGKTTVDFGTSGFFRDLALQRDGRIVATGADNSTSGVVDFGLARLLPDGSLDSSFDGDGKARVAFGAGGSGNQDYGYAVAIQPDSRIVVGGQVYTTSNGRDFGVARLLPSGVLDPSFGSGGKALVAFDLGQNNDDEAFALAIRPDSRILVGGTAQRAESGDYDFAFTQLLGDQVFADGFEAGDTSAWTEPRRRRDRAAPGIPAPLTLPLGVIGFSLANMALATRRREITGRRPPTTCPRATSGASAVAGCHP